MVQNVRHHDRVAAAILDAAAHELAVNGAKVAMADVAERAGVSRATVYNYFDSREDLLRALHLATIDGVRQHLSGVNLDQLSVSDAVARLATAVIASGTKFQVAANPVTGTSVNGLELLRPPLEQLLARGRHDGTVRIEIHDDLAFAMFCGLLAGALKCQLNMGVEETGQHVAALFINGVTASA
jgi:AcrR family transcriptional regulator